VKDDDKNAKERMYDRIPLKVSHLNFIIVVLVVAIVAFLVLGVLIGNRIISGPRFLNRRM